MSREHFYITLEQAQDIATHVRHFVFTRSDRKAFQFIPGQFITLHIPHQAQSGKILRRSYSLANSPSENSRIELAASYISGGIASELLFQLKSGDQLEATGPFGRLILTSNMPKRLILVATGTGITPYRSMLPELENYLEKNDDFELLLLFGVRQPQDLLYRDEFIRLTQKYNRFEFRAYYSRVYPNDPAVHEYSGYVLEAFGNLTLNPITDVVYLCGNPNMVDQVFSLLTERGFTSGSIRREKYISSN